jgi:DNA polymerase III delta prime subunit
MAFKIIVLDGADLIPPSAQQILKKVLHDQEGKVKYIFVCRDQSKLIGHILSRGLTYRTRSMNERDAVGLSLES